MTVCNMVSTSDGMQEDWRILDLWEGVLRVGSWAIKGVRRN